MTNPIYDLEDGELFYALSDEMAIDDEGNVVMKMTDDMILDMESGDIHLISPWESNDDDF